MLKNSLILIFCWSAVARPAFGLTLEQAFEQALSQLAAYQNQEINVEIARRQKRLAVGSLLPTLSAQSVNTWREQPADSSGVATRFGEEHQHNAQLTLVQPLFQGGSEYYGLGIASKEVDRQRLIQNQTKLDIFLRVATEYYNVLIWQEDIEVLKDQIDLLNRRIRFLRNRVRIGRTKSTAVLSAEAEHARVDAEMAMAQNQLDMAVQQLSYLIGTPVDRQELETRLDPRALSFSSTAEELARELPDVRAVQTNLDQARSEVRVVQGGMLPRLEASGNYYLDRSGILEGSSWEVNLVATWTLFNGGRRWAQMQIERLEVQKLERDFEDILRRRRTEIQSARETFQSQITQLEKLEHAVRLAERNYQTHQAEYDRGLVSDLDVIQAMNDFLTVKRSLTRTRLQAQLSYFRAQSAAGVLP